MKLNIRKLSVAGLLGALSVVMGLVPMIGFIPVPTAAQNATIMQIPAILGAVAEGPAVGLFVGFIFGLMSWLRATNPMFADPLVAVLPRLFIGVAAYYAFAAARRLPLSARLGVAAVVGTLTNTVLVLSLIVLRGYLTGAVALSVGLIHGSAEVIVAVIIVTAIGLALARAGFLRRSETKAGRSA